MFLRDIIDRESAMTELSYKTPVIQKEVRIMPALKKNSDQPIGMLRVKLRIRKPISEALRFYREKNELQTL